MTSQNCFLCFCAVRNLLFQNFLFPLAFDNKDVLFMLNSNDDTTLNFKRGVLRICGTMYEFIQIRYVISQLIFEILEKCSSFQLSLNNSFKIDIKMGRF